MFLFLFSLIPSVSFSHDDIKIVAGPYLQNVGENEITIMWVTSEETKDNRVYYGIHDLDNTVKENKEGKIHEVMLSPLSPNSTYIYMVSSDGVKSKTYHFKTSSQNQSNFKFIVYGDSRGMWDGWKNAGKVARAIENEEANFVISTGDMVRNGMDEEQWISFLSTSSFMHNTTLYPAVGNHDLPSLDICRYFSIPNETWYSFDYGIVHFTIINSNTPYIFSPFQFLWLMKDLHCKNRWKFVVFHHPPYSSGEHGNNTFLRLLLPLFKMDGVDAIFNGHDHDYEHIKVWKMTFIVSGGGGAPLYRVGKSPWTIFSSSSYHYCRVNVSYSFLHFTVLKPDGEILEEFEMAK